MSDNTIVFESTRPFSQCALWDLQRDFFICEGVNAWDYQVPFYITSNPFIANCYANVIIRFMQDWRNTEDYCRDEPFYIFELGAGCGRFAFYALRRLLDLQQQLALEDIHFVYVLTDFAKSNIDFWRSHPAWQAFIDKQQVDFACFDVENDTQVTLLRSGKIIGPGDKGTTLVNPGIFIANYVFDSLRHDIFRQKNGELYEAIAILTTDKDNLEMERVVDLASVSVDFSYKKIDSAYYGVDAFDRLLKYYRGQLDNEHIVLPIGGLRCLQNLHALSDGCYLLLSADKGGVELCEVVRRSAPGISLHGGGFSMQVNFHAMTGYMQNAGGDYYHASVQPGISTVALLSGACFSGLPETHQALDTHLQRQSPAVIFNLYTYIRDTIRHCPPDTFLALMTITDWDPHIFNKYIEVLLTRLDKCTATTLYALKAAVAKIADHFYYMPGAIDTLAGIALFFQELQDYDKALDYYRQSVIYYGQADHIAYNMGLCYCRQGNIEQGLERFEQALLLNPELACARQQRDNLQRIKC